MAIRDRDLRDRDSTSSNSSEFNISYNILAFFYLLRNREHTANTKISIFFLCLVFYTIFLFRAGQPAKRAIVTTQFVEWASSAFARPEGGDSWRSDCESRPHHERVWRYARNRSLRKEAAGECVSCAPAVPLPAQCSSNALPRRPAARARGAAGDAGLPLALPAAARRRAVPPLRAARRRRLQGQLRVSATPSTTYTALVYISDHIAAILALNISSELKPNCFHV